MDEVAKADLKETAQRPTDGLVEGVFLALRRLDVLLRSAIAQARLTYDSEPSMSHFRGLCIREGEVDRLLSHEPGAPKLCVAAQDRGAASQNWCDDSAGLTQLQRAFGLSPIDLDVILIALAPEIDLKYERLYAYLQDDVTRKWPTVDLCLNLLCDSAEAKLGGRAHFSPAAPLIRQKLVHLIGDPNQLQPPLLAHYLKLDEQIVRMLLGQPGLDGRLINFCHLSSGKTSLDHLPLDPKLKRALPKLLEAPAEEQRTLVLHLRGPSKSLMRQAAEAAAWDRGSSLLLADLSCASDNSADFDETVALVLREAQFQGAIPYVEGVDRRSPVDLRRALATARGIVILASSEAIPSPVSEEFDLIPVSFSPLNANQRRDCWDTALATRGAIMEDETLDGLADRFRFTDEQISRAVAAGSGSARWRRVSQKPESCLAQRDQPTSDELYTAARAQSGSELGSVARKLDPIYTWSDLVLPSNTLTQLHEICQRINHHEYVLHEWGFDRKLSLGKGTSALFAGPSGTGKTMAAEVIANEVRLDLYKIDLAGVVSKYIGETEKNLDRIFTAAEGSNAILFFDEADALFGKRSEVRDSHDRYANIEVSYLLQKMEAYEGATILATNLRQHMDDSFIRRLAFTVLFPFPDEDDRQRIWKGIWPGETPIEELDFGYLAKNFKLSGGNIKNIALAAAFLAASNGGVVRMAHLFQATRREYQKMGKALSEAELCGANETEKSRAPAAESVLK